METLIIIKLIQLNGITSKSKFAKVILLKNYSQINKKNTMKNKHSFDRNKLRRLYEYDYSCSLCGSNQELQFHHIKHKRELSESIFNSLRLCRKCHSKYGSSSAEDINEHLNISLSNIYSRVKHLSKADLSFNMNICISLDDKSFITANLKNYSDINRKLIKEMK